MSAFADIGNASFAPPGLAGIGAAAGAAQRGVAGQVTPNLQQLNDPAFQAKFQAAADAGYFGQPAWLTGINNEVNAAFQTNNNQGYDDAYNQSMAVARGNIQQQIGNALAEINQRQGIANQGLAQLPGQINQNFTQAQQGVQSDVAAMNAQEAAIGGAGTNGTFNPGDAAAQPGLAAIAASNAGAQSGVPVLKLAFDNAFSNQRQTVNDQGQQQLNDLQQKAADRQVQLQQSMMDDKNSMTRSLIIQHYQDQAAQTKAAQAAAAKQGAAAAKAVAAAPPGITAAGGKAIIKYTPDIAANIKSQQGTHANTAYHEALATFQEIQQKFPTPTAKRTDKAYAGQYKLYQQGVKATKKATQLLAKKWPKQSAALNVAAADAGL